MVSFDFENLFVFDLANNHQGDLKHAKNIINQIGEISKKKNIKGVFKLQFRNLDTFIHKDFLKDESNTNVQRFLSTKLNWDDYKKIRQEISKSKMFAMCTPFDEDSVEKIKEMKFDIIKVASCSASDWPLLEKISQSGLPVIISTGGLLVDDIDKLVSFFEHKGSDFAIMHCVSIYPTPREKSQLNMITTLRKRYPNLTIGWSTHEDPNDFEIAKIAYSLGARVFERHVGIENTKYKLNKYSSNPEQISKWIDSVCDAKKIIGESTKVIDKKEIEALYKLKRGIYLKNKLKKGSKVTSKDIYFSFPLCDGQIESGFWSDELILNNDVSIDQPLFKKDVNINHKQKNNLKTSVHLIKGMLNEAKVFLNPEFEVEFSHHYGPENFLQTGATIINCINREYCKKILILLPGQSHPAHFHKKKEETFNLLHGDVTIWLEGKEKKLLIGENCLVMPGVWHSFSTEEGCIIEEISTTHYKNDSVYKDPYINELKLEDRKTKVPNWGRFYVS